MAHGRRYLRYVALDEQAAGSGYPFDLPAVAGLRRAWLTLGPGAAFLVGENGSGKSTLVEAVAVAAGLNPEGGSRSFRFATRSSESPLGDALRLGRAPGRERDAFFLRAEGYYNVALAGSDRPTRGSGSPDSRVRIPHSRVCAPRLAHRGATARTGPGQSPGGISSPRPRN